MITRPFCNVFFVVEQRRCEEKNRFGLFSCCHSNHSVAQDSGQKVLVSKFPFSENARIEIPVKMCRRTFHLVRRVFYLWKPVSVEELLSSLFNFFVELTVNMIPLSFLFNMFQSTGHLLTSLITSCPPLAYMWKLFSRGK